MWRAQRSIDRAVAAVSIAVICWLLGPGIGIVNAILGPAAGTTRSMNWLEQASVAPEDALLRCLTAIGLVAVVRLMAGFLLALATRVPGRTGIRAAKLSYYVTPPRARRLIHVMISVGLSSWASAALTAPALAATHPAAAVVPAPVLAPPEATLQTWPDLGRPGTDVPTSPAPKSTVRNWPDLGRPGRDVPTSPAPKSTVHNWPDLGRPGRDVPTSPPLSPTRAPEQPSSASRSQLPAVNRDQTAGATRPTKESTSRPPDADASRPEIVVMPGDCLWTLAERDLQHRHSTEPSDSEIAAVTEKWWLANRVEIGANPDRLLPGQRLQPPA